jgi:hypothetical protein
MYLSTHKENDSSASCSGHSPNRICIGVKQILDPIGNGTLTVQRAAQFLWNPYCLGRSPISMEPLLSSAQPNFYGTLTVQGAGQFLWNPYCPGRSPISMEPLLSSAQPNFYGTLTVQRAAQFLWNPYCPGRSPISMPNGNKMRVMHQDCGSYKVK